MYKYAILLIILCWAGFKHSGFAQAPPSLRVMTFNIRLNTSGDGYNAWPHRTDLVESMIRFHNTDLFGVQEALENQMEDLREMFPDFGSLGVARDTNRKWAEYSAIFYRKSRLDLLEGNTFWLSETPEKMSKGWDAALNRICTWGKFKDKQTGNIFFHFNTHFDHRGQKARAESARLIRAMIQQLNPDQLPVIVTGDFNITPDSEPYQVLTDKTQAFFLKDAFFTSQQAHHGPASTWSGFQFPGVEGRRIDYVFTQYNVAVLQHATLSESWSGRFPSDHLPVLAEVLIDPVLPLPNAHAHNDYEHDRPLLDALDHGFTSVEADIWLIDGELYVAHDRPGDLSSVPTLKAAYLEPLAKVISTQNGAVYPGSVQPFLLMIDFKNKGAETYEKLKTQLAEYNWMLTGKNRNPAPIRIFISGDRPIDAIISDKARWAGVDGRPNDLGKGFSADHMPVISQHYRRVIGWNGKGDIPAKDKDMLTSLATRAHAEGKKVRLWASPESESVWKVLLEAGIDLINTDELARLQKFLGSR